MNASRVRPSRLLILQGLVAVALAGCGSTVSGQNAGVAPTGPAAELGSDLAPSTGPSGAASLAGTGAPGAGVLPGSTTGTGQVQPLQAGVHGRTQSAAGGSGSVPAPVAANTLTGPGVTPTTISIGLYRTKNPQDYAAQFGVKNESQAADEDIKHILINYYNKHGGLAGHRLVGVWHTFDGQSTADASTNEQQACEDLTVDHKVFATLEVSSGATWQSCIAKAGVLDIQSAFYTSDEQYFTRFPNLIMSQALNYSRLARAYVDGLVDGGFLTARNRIGLVYTDAPRMAEPVKSVLIPELKRRGLALADSYGTKDIQTQDDTATAVSDLNSAVLRFHTHNIDRVLFMNDYGGIAVIVFMQDAQQQNYYPKYGLNSLYAPEAIADQASIRPSLVGSQAVGYTPAVDVTPAQVGLGPADKRCIAILKAGGYQVASDVNGRGTALADCEPFFVLAAALKENGNAAINLPNVLAAIGRIGTSYVPTETMGARFTPAEHDGVYLWRPAAYFSSCTCFRYTGGIRRVD